MKILIYSIHFIPEPTGIGKFTGEMAEWLAAKGHQVQVVSAIPFYPQWQIYTGYPHWRYVYETRFPKIRSAQSSPDMDDGSLVAYRCPLWLPKKLSAVHRILHLASYSLSTLPVMLRQSFWKPDIVWVVEPPLIGAPIGLFTARFCGAKSWLHIQDFEVDAAISLGVLKGRISRRIALTIEKWLTKHFDLVSSISSRMVVRIGEKGVPETQTFLFPNWVDVRDVYPLPYPSPMRSTLGIDENTCVVLFSGTLGYKQGLEILIEAARQLKGLDILLTICGNGSYRDYLMRYANGLPNVRFLDLQPKERLNELLNLADIHVLPQREDVEDLVMPSKLIGMLASGRPVVATVNPKTEISNILETCGITVQPGNVCELSNTIAALAADGVRRKSLGSAARKYALEHWEREMVLSRFEEHLINLVGIANDAIKNQ